MTEYGNQGGYVAIYRWCYRTYSIILIPPLRTFSVPESDHFPRTTTLTMPCTLTVKAVWFVIAII